MKCWRVNLWLTLFSKGKVQWLKWWLPKWYPYFTDNSSTVLKIESFWFADQLYILVPYQKCAIHCSWILIFGSFCTKNELFNFKSHYFFFILLQIGYPYCTNKLSYSFQDRQLLVCGLITGYIYIKDLHTTWILIFANFCQKYQLLNLHGH